MMNEVTNKLWVEKYRPRTIDECILTPKLKSSFTEFVKEGYIPNLILTGGPGVGKTTVAKAMCNECNFDERMINGSMDGNIDTLRTIIRNFASTVSFLNNRKYVILDEADYLNPQSTQPALRNFMEEFSHNCGFIMTCNYKNRIIAPLQSRCSVIDFKLTNKDKTDLAKQFMKRLTFILKEEGIKYSTNVLGQLLLKHFGDWRRIINEVQLYSAGGEIDTGILVNMSADNYKILIKSLKEKDFKTMRTWVGQNSDTDASEIFRHIYDHSTSLLESKSIPQLVLILAEYGYKAAFVSDSEINLVACLTEVMSSCEFK